MSSQVIVPVKSFAMGKGRLSSTLDANARARLGRALADHVVSTALATRLFPLVVSADEEVLTWATSAGVTALTDPGEGLNVAVSCGVEKAGDSPWLILHSDLPLLAAQDLKALTAPLDEGRHVIAPSADGGTSAIGGQGTMDFAFGVTSFQRHLVRLDAPLIVIRPGLLLDIDSPRDLEVAANTDRGAWLQDHVPARSRVDPFAEHDPGDSPEPILTP